MGNGGGKHVREVLYVMAVILIIQLTGTSVLKAQTSQTLYFMERIPQSGLLNPSYQHDHEFYLGIPMASSFNFNARSNFISFNDVIFRHHQYDSIISFMHPDADKGKFIARLKSLNTVEPDFYFGMLSAGYRRNKSYFRFDVADRASARVDLPRDLAMLAFEGNEQYAGRTADFSGFSGEMSYFREYAAGYSYDINKFFNVGVRAKLLFGKADMSFSGSEMNLYTDPESYNIRLLTDFEMQMSMPLSLVTDDDGRIDEIKSHFDREDYGRGKFLFSSRNPGFAFDAGTSFRIAEMVTLFASITDLGFISWKRDAYSLSVNTDYIYDGVDISPFFDSGDDSSPVSALLDTLKGLISTDEQAYRRSLPSRLYFGGTWVHRSGMNIGLLSRFDIAGNNPERVVTASVMKDIIPSLTATFSYSFMNRHYNNPGIGLTFRKGNYNIYFITDNLTSTVVPRRKRSLNMLAGFNLAFGERALRDSGK